MTTTTVLTDQQVRIGKLLLNAWSAEFALRSFPFLDDETWPVSARTFTFPQVYYAGLFSARAVLSTYGYNIASESLVTVLMDEEAEKGLYDQDCDVKNGYAELLPYHLDPVLPANQSLRDYHAKAVVKVEQVSRAHERAIMAAIGIDAFRSIVNGIPEHLRTEFLAERFKLISSQS